MLLKVRCAFEVEVSAEFKRVHISTAHRLAEIRRLVSILTTVTDTDSLTVSVCVD